MIRTELAHGSPIDKINALSVRIISFATLIDLFKRLSIGVIDSTMMVKYYMSRIYFIHEERHSSIIIKLSMESKKKYSMYKISHFRYGLFIRIAINIEGLTDAFREM